MLKQRNVWVLVCAQSLALSAAPLVVFCGGIVGSQLAPNSKLATLPVAFIIIGTAAFIFPLSLLSKAFGRKTVFLLAMTAGVAASILAGVSIQIDSFAAFCCAIFLLGGVIAAVQQFRFAAMESVDPSTMPKAASLVLAGGIAAAFLGPEIALRGRNLISADFAGAFFVLAGVYAVATVVLVGFQNPSTQIQDCNQGHHPLRKALANWGIWTAILSATVGYAVMSFIMTATPVSMHLFDGHSLEHSKVVIQSHVMAMYLPSLFAGVLIQRLGQIRMMSIGLGLFVLCVVIGFSGQALLHYWWALLALGIGWNFLFVSGTALLPRFYGNSDPIKIQAFNDFLVFGFQAIAALLSGWIIHQFGWSTVLIVSLPFLGIQALVMILWHHSSKNSMVGEYGAKTIS